MAEPGLHKLLAEKPPAPKLGEPPSPSPGPVVLPFPTGPFFVVDSFFALAYKSFPRCVCKEAGP